MARQAGVRLLIAVLLSAAVHVSLIFGVAVRPPQRPLEPRYLSARLARVPATPPDGSNERRTASGAALPRPTIDHTSERRPLAPAAAALAAPRPAEPALMVATPAPSPAGSAAPLPAVNIPLLTDPTWYQARQLDVFPQALSAVRPAYPEQAAQTAVSGEVMLELLIDESGRVHAAEVVRATPEGYFEAAAVSAFQAARFVPGQKDGRAVRSRVVVKVVFSPDDPARE